MTPQELTKIQGYLRRVFGNKAFAVHSQPKKSDVADVLIGDKVLGQLLLDDEDGDRSYQLGFEIKEKPQPLSVTEMVRLQTFLREKLGCKTLSVRARGKLKDSAEVYAGDDSIAILTADKASYQFQMAILDIDLEDVAD
jgi:Protein of unknown function (DUF3126)